MNEEEGERSRRKPQKSVSGRSPSKRSKSSSSFDGISSRRSDKWHESMRASTKTLLSKFKASEKWCEESKNGKEVEDAISKDVEPETAPTNSQWSEHVWCTFIDRTFTDNISKSPSKLDGKDLLTDFQQEKFKHFFYHVLDLNSDHVISAEDFEKLNARVMHYMDWSVNTIQYLALKEVHGIFLENFLTMSSRLWRQRDESCFDWNLLHEDPCLIEKPCVTIEEWLDVWGNLVGDARKINDLPMWLQCYPKTLFDTINRSGSGIISMHELQLFFTAFLDVGTLGEEKVNQLTKKSYSAMTVKGEIPLDYHVYNLSFMNFLLGKQPNGPGQFIFGMMTPGSERKVFPVDYSAVTQPRMNDEKESFSVDMLTSSRGGWSIIV